MLSRDGDRLAHAEAIGISDTAARRSALAFIDDENNRRFGAPQLVREMLVRRRNTGPPIDHEERDIGFFESALGLFHHAAPKAVRARFLQPGGIGHAEAQRADAPFALAPVAGHAGRFGDDGEAPSDQAIK